MGRVIDFLREEGKNPSKEFQEFNSLYEQYIEKFEDIDWDDFSAQNACSREELSCLIRMCLKENRHMEHYHPEWCDECPSDIYL